MTEYTPGVMAVGFEGGLVMGRVKWWKGGMKAGGVGDVGPNAILDITRAEEARINK